MVIRGLSFIPIFLVIVLRSLGLCLLVGLTLICVIIRHILVFENTPILLEEELHGVCGGPLNQFYITQSKVLEKINAKAAQVDVNPDDVNELVDELMDDAGGNVNAPRRAYSSSMTPHMFDDYHHEIMAGIQALQTLSNAHTT
ncbi:hypothetical protein Dimus_030320 [Dionaea muscipula]